MLVQDHKDCLYLVGLVLFPGYYYWKCIDGWYKHSKANSISGQYSRIKISVKIVIIFTYLEKTSWKIIGIDTSNHFIASSNTTTIISENYRIDKEITDFKSVRLGIGTHDSWNFHGGRKNLAADFFSDLIQHVSYLACNTCQACGFPVAVSTLLHAVSALLNVVVHAASFGS